ncbi:MAG: hypothetical protein RR328_00485 [Bacteroidales bacterium]
MNLKEAIKKNRALSYIIQALDLQTSVGREMLLSTPFYTNAALICAENERLNQLDCVFDELTRHAIFEKIKIKLHQIRDISPTLQNIGNGVLDDVQLFEIKNFALLSTQIKEIIEKLNVPNMPALRALQRVIEILDPLNEILPSFYIYDAYNASLAQKRKELKDELEKQDKDIHTFDTDIIQQLRQTCIQIEDEVRQDLSKQLGEYKEDLIENMKVIAYWDIAIAKVTQARDWNLVSAHWAPNNQNIVLRGLFHPQLKYMLKQSHKHYQCIDISLYPHACLLTGANMSGKTVLLKSLALAQLLFQYGFFVPAQDALLPIFDEVCLLVDDGQSELQGLSSFASEVNQLNDVFTQMEEGRKIFLLIDELARTTNPIEGSAIVQGVLDCLEQYNSTALISTHYGDINGKSRRLRVKGLQLDALERGNIKKTALWNIDNIQKLMDYSLVEEEATQNPPLEALTIAEILNLHPKVLDKAKMYFQQKVQQK